MSIKVAVSTEAQSHIGAVVHVEYGRCAGLPTLMGKGRIAAEKTVRGSEYFLVEPIEGNDETIPLAKWVMRGEIKGYDWTVPAAPSAPAVKVIERRMPAEAIKVGDEVVFHGSLGFERVTRVEQLRGIERRIYLTNPNAKNIVLKNRSVDVFNRSWYMVRRAEPVTQTAAFAAVR